MRAAGARYSQVRALLGVHDGSDGDTKVGDGSPEICKMAGVLALAAWLM